jgi:arabinofuranan 3-O-arabinosyltransferase
MNKRNPLVSIVIPVKNSGFYLQNCLASIHKQTYSPIEVLLIDSHSTDNTEELAKKFHYRLILFAPKLKNGVFEAPHKRNYGASVASGKYIYYLDADMELPKGLITEAVMLCEGKKYDAVTLSEDSFGIGIWARAKNLERRCYWGDETIEAPRFIRRSVWLDVGGMDEQVGGGGDDWDLYQKLLEKGYKVSRAKSIVRHNEGNLRLKHLMKKRFMYGTQTLRYISKRPREGIISYFPFRKAYFRHWRSFLARPGDTLAFIIMRSAEYAAGFAGIIFGILHK